MNNLAFGFVWIALILGVALVNLAPPPIQKSALRMPIQKFQKKIIGFSSIGITDKPVVRYEISATEAVSIQSNLLNTNEALLLKNPIIVFQQYSGKMVTFKPSSAEYHLKSSTLLFRHESNQQQQLSIINLSENTFYTIRNGRQKLTAALFQN